LALAVSLEEEDSRIYRHFRERLKEKHPEAAAIIQSIYEEEISHQARLTELYHQTFGEHILFIRTHDVKGFLTLYTSRYSLFPSTLGSSGSKKVTLTSRRIAGKICVKIHAFVFTPNHHCLLQGRKLACSDELRPTEVFHDPRGNKISRRNTHRLRYGMLRSFLNQRRHFLWM
jgi:rubrerythrin